uniref:Uncharacterized protein LOC114339645 n=1 Tax=Diabrotica virgifera virgifera TaxID=50390 RepID=A0A6P7GLK4_DIAVI
MVTILLIVLLRVVCKCASYVQWILNVTPLLTWTKKIGEETLNSLMLLLRSAADAAAVKEVANDFEKFFFNAWRQIEKSNDLFEECKNITDAKGQPVKELSNNLHIQMKAFREKLEDGRERIEDSSRCFLLLESCHDILEDDGKEQDEFVKLAKHSANEKLLQLCQNIAIPDTNLTNHNQPPDKERQDQDKSPPYSASEISAASTPVKSQNTHIRRRSVSSLAFIYHCSHLAAGEMCNCCESDTENTVSYKLKKKYIQALQSCPCGTKDTLERKNSGTLGGIKEESVENILEKIESEHNDCNRCDSGVSTAENSVGDEILYNKKKLQRICSCQYYRENCALCSAASSSTGSNQDTENQQDSIIEEGSDGFVKSQRQIEKSNDLFEECKNITDAKGQPVKELSNNLHIQMKAFREKLEDGRERIEDSSRCFLLLESCHDILEDDGKEQDEFVKLAKRSANEKLLQLCQNITIPDTNLTNHNQPPDKERQDQDKSPPYSASEISAASTPVKSQNTHIRRRSVSSLAFIYHCSHLAAGEMCNCCESDTENTVSYKLKKKYIQALQSCPCGTKDTLERKNSGTLGGIKEESVENILEKIESEHNDCNRCDSGVSTAENSVGDEILYNKKKLQRICSCQYYRENCALCSAASSSTGSNQDNTENQQDSIIEEGSDGFVKRTLTYIITEMIETERDYVKSLDYVIINYIPELQREDIPQALRGQRNTVFGNVEKIFEFHSHHFLNELEECINNPLQVGQIFLKYDKRFYLYALYNKNKPKSDSLMSEYGSAFFRSKQIELADKMDLASYLLKPVQRMGKYALLLQQMMKACPASAVGSSDRVAHEMDDLKQAEEMVRFQLRHGNDLLAMDSIRECDVSILVSSYSGLRTVRMAEMSSMGIGNKPCLDIRPSDNQISDRSISFAQLSRTVPRFRNSIAGSITDSCRIVARPQSVISMSSVSSSSTSSGGSAGSAGTPIGPSSNQLGLGFETCESPKSFHKSSTLNSQCSVESGIIADMSVGSDEFSEQAPSGL